jgi:hypothetical protein
MEAVARQFASNKKCMVIRNGWFSYRWTQIFEMGDISKDLHIIKGSQRVNEFEGAFAPPPIAREPVAPHWPVVFTAWGKNITFTAWD